MSNLSNFKKGTIAWYEQAYKEMVFDKGFETEISRAARRVQAGMFQYRDLQAKYGVPAQFIGCLHNMECLNNFRGYLGNGELIIGTGRKSTLVPKGRGPFGTFEAGAADAFKLDGLLGIKDWSLGLELLLAEKFNGTGYLKYHAQENSPYIWACTSINDGKGKYVRDGVYDPNAPTNGQVGVAAIYKQLEIWGEFKPVFSSDHPVVPIIQPLV
jgi:lysozyme family protein